MKLKFVNFFSEFKIYNFCKFRNVPVNSSNFSFYNIYMKFITIVICYKHRLEPKRPSAILRAAAESNAN